ncbi:MAG: type II toxin-antitoxin system VapC family toxin [Chloroflexi bacterium]|nr:type II toxin-antitoxin system VapC family toxin [Chloroflexota bacterium]
MNEPARQIVTSYVDSSALVKRYLVEIGTSWMQTWCADPTQTIAVAEIGLVEIAAAFAGKLRGAHIMPAQYQSARTDLTIDARDEYVLVTVNRAVVDEAIELTARHRLRGYDAVHLACALTLNRALVAYHLSPLAFISADDDLLKAAAAEGLPTDNPNRHP